MATKVTPELKALRNEANELGVKYHWNAGADSLRNLIESHKNMPAAPVIMDEGLQPAALQTGKVDYLTEAQFKAQEAAQARKDVNKLVRIRVQCMNPCKKEWPGEFLSVGSDFLGTYKKFVPYDNTPYHVPKIIFDFMKERKCSSFYTATDSQGNKTRKSKLIPEFAIEVMSPLTHNEIQLLAQQQAMREGAPLT